MLNPRQNPFDILDQLPQIWSTATNPRWCLIWSSEILCWSAFDYDEVDDLLEVALNPSWVTICLLPPKSVASALSYSRPDYISQNLHSCATLHRAKASDLDIMAFAPDLTEVIPDTNNGAT